MIRKIVPSTDPKLREVSKPVKKIDKKIKAIIKDLKDTLVIQKDPEGVGLAAPQIGKNLRIFYAKYKKLNKIVINPEIIKISKQKKVHTKKHQDHEHEILEGCLSLPNYYGPLKRSPYVVIKYMNEKGEKVEEKFTGFNAQIILHEIDHLDGVLFVDHLLEQNKRLYKLNKDDEWEEIELI